MHAGQIVTWENNSFIISTKASGEVVDLHDTYVVIKRLDMIERYPHQCPYVVKRIHELEIVEEHRKAA